MRIAGAQIESLRSTTRRLNDALWKQRNLPSRTKTMNNLWSQEYSQRLCHSQLLSRLSSNMKADSDLRAVT